MSDKKTRIWIIALAAVCVVCAALFLLLKTARTGTVAVISVDGEEYGRIDLSAVEAAYDIEIDTEYGHNTVHVEPGAISVSAADCPDQICVEQGAISGGGVPIICMPHRLVIQLEGSGIDG